MDPDADPDPHQKCHGSATLVSSKIMLKFGICTVMGLNATLVEDKMRTF
jgi:hypothetical protein